MPLQAPPIKFSVVRGSPGMQTDYERVGLDSEQVQVEERVQISAKQESVVGCIVGLRAIGSNVCCLERIKYRTSGN